MTASRHRPGQVRAAIDAVGAPAEAAWPALRVNHSIEGRVLPRLLWHCQLPCAPASHGGSAIACMPQLAVQKRTDTIFKPTACYNRLCTSWYIG